tara:strand:+ start:452 stop:631 length:180 start_codon:yes stop_codon:yes gene_type:complete
MRDDHIALPHFVGIQNSMYSEFMGHDSVIYHDFSKNFLVMSSERGYSVENRIPVMFLGS